MKKSIFIVFQEDSKYYLFLFHKFLSNLSWKISGDIRDIYRYSRYFMPEAWGINSKAAPSGLNWPVTTWGSVGITSPSVTPSLSAVDQHWLPLSQMIAFKGYLNKNTPKSDLPPHTLTSVHWRHCQKYPPIWPAPPHSDLGWLATLPGAQAIWLAIGMYWIKINLSQRLQSLEGRAYPGAVDISRTSCRGQ